MINPFFTAIISYLMVFCIFTLKWSSLYQTLSIKLIIFFILNSIFCTIMFIIFRRKINIKKIYIKDDNKEKRKRNKNIVIYIFIAYLINFLYSKEIPIVNAITGIGSYYKDIKMIPTIYPLITAINVFSVVYIFYDYICFKKREDLFLVMMLTIPMIINMGRGILIMAIFPCGLLYLSSVKKIINFKVISKLILAILIFLYAFGYFGNMRDQNKSLNNLQRSEIILNLGYATENFGNSFIPNEYFWSYLYIVSPIGNLNNFISNKPIDGNIKDYLVYNFMPQSLQKKIIDLDKFEMYRRSNLVNQTFNVSTTFAMPYYLFGWWGVFFYQIIYWVLFFLGYIFVKKTNYENIYLAFFSVLSILSLFDNILQMDAIFIPIIMCIIFALLSRVRVKFTL